MSAPTLRYEIGSIVVPGDRLCTIDQVSMAGIGTHIHYGHIHASIAGELKLVRLTETEKNDERSSKLTTKKKKKKQQYEYQVQVKPLKKKLGRQKQLLAKDRVLKIGQIVLAKVVRITSQQVIIEILATTPMTTADTITASSSSNSSKHPKQHQQEQQEIHFFSLGDCPEAVIHKNDIWPSTSTSSTALLSPSQNNTTNTSTITKTGAIDGNVSKEMQDCFQPLDLILCQILSLGDMRRYFCTTATHPYLGVLSAKTEHGKLLIPNYSDKDTFINEMVVMMEKEEEAKEHDDDHNHKKKKYLRKCAQPRKLV